MKFSLQPGSIKTRVTFSALAVFLFSLWLLMSLSSWLLEQDIAQLVADNQLSAATQMAAQLDRELGSRLAALEQIAARINAAMIENPEVVQQLLEEQPLLQNLFNVSVMALNKNGISIADYPYMAERIGVDYRVRVAAFAVALDEGRANIGNPLMAPTIGVPLIPLAVPIRDGSGQVIGALGGAIDLSKPNFFDAVSDENYGKKGLYSVVSRNLRTIVTSSDPSRIMLQLPSAGINPVLDRALVGEEGMDIYINEQGVKMLATVRQISAAAWFVAVMTPVTEAFAPIKDMQRRMTLVALAVILLVGIIIWWLLQRQLRPILTTVDTLGQMTETLRPAQSLKLTGRKEVDNLIGAFNRLLEYLTGREQALQESEDALKRQNALFNVLLDNLVTGVFMVEAPSGKPLIANQAARHLLGRGILPEASGENLSAVYRAQKAGSGESYPLADMPIILGMSGEVSHVDDMLVERPDATKIRLEVFGTPVRNDKGEVWASLVSFYDITERKAAEEENRRFKTIADNAVYGKAIADLEGNLVYVNRFFAELHGYSPEGLVGKHYSIFHTANQLENVDNSLSQLRQDGYFSPCEVWHLHRNGTEFPMLMSGVLLRDDYGNPQYLAASAVDITESKQAELALQHKNEELEQFVYIVSHDLRSPLITINTFLGMLREDIRDNNTAGIKDDLDFIREASAKMESLLNALLQLSRIGRIDSSPQKQPVKTLVDECLKILAGILQQHQVKVVTGELSCQWCGDPLLLGQIWQNLIENAVKYMGDQPQPRIEIGAEHRAEGLVFYVRDNGIGIAPENHQRIFSIFAQLDRNSEGTGLGLALVQKIVSSYRGDIWVESAGKGQGSCFCFILPQALVSDSSLLG